MNAVLEEKVKPIAAYDPFRAQLADLRKLNSQVVFDYEDPKGNKEARSHIHKLRKTKAAVDKARKQEKQEALDYGRRVDAEAKEIIGEIESMIEVHEKPIKEIEEREKARVEQHTNDIMEIVNAGTVSLERWMDLSVETMRDRLAEIESEDMSEDRWEEFLDQAIQARTTTMQQIADAIAKREKHDAEQAELEQLRKAEAERQAKEREDALKREAEEKAKREAEEQVEREREARIQAEREKQEAQQRAEQAEHNARLKAQQELEEQQRQEAEAQRQREANMRYKGRINSEAKACFAAKGFSEDDAERIVKLIAKGEIDHVSIQY